MEEEWISRWPATSWDKSTPSLVEIFSVWNSARSSVLRQCWSALMSAIQVPTRLSVSAPRWTRPVLSTTQSAFYNARARKSSPKSWRTASRELLDASLRDTMEISLSTSLFTEMVLEMPWGDKFLWWRSSSWRRPFKKPTTLPDRDLRSLLSLWTSASLSVSSLMMAPVALSILLQAAWLILRSLRAVTLLTSTISISFLRQLLRAASYLLTSTLPSTIQTWRSQFLRSSPTTSATTTTIGPELSRFPHLACMHTRSLSCSCTWARRQEAFSLEKGLLSHFTSSEEAVLIPVFLWRQAFTSSHYWVEVLIYIYGEWDREIWG